MGSYMKQLPTGGLIVCLRILKVGIDDVVAVI